MTESKREQAREEALELLKKGTPRNKIIRRLSERWGLSNGEAREITDQVQQAHPETLRTNAIILIVVGLVLSGIGLVIAVAGWELPLALIPGLAGLYFLVRGAFNLRALYAQRR